MAVTQTVLNKAPDPLGRWPKKPWTRFARWGKRPNRRTNLELLTTTILLCVAVVFGFAQLSKLSAHDRAAQQVEDHRAWEFRTDTFSACLLAAEAKVSVRLDFRSNEIADAQALVTLVEEFFPGSTRAAEFAKGLREEKVARLNANFPEYNLAEEQAKCLPPGPEPPPG